MRSDTRRSRTKFSKEVIERDGQCCVYENGKRCPITNPLFAHHIIPRRSKLDDVKEDGLTCCEYHHGLIEEKKIKIKASWLLKSQILFIIKRKWRGWPGIEWDA